MPPPGFAVDGIVTSAPAYGKLAGRNPPKVRKYKSMFKKILAREVNAWQDHRNKHHAKANWQFKTADARVKLKRLYPQFG